MYTRLPLYFCRQVSIQKMKTKEEGGGNCEDKDDQEKDGTEEEDRRRNMPNNNTPVKTIIHFPVALTTVTIGTFAAQSRQT